MGKVLLAPTRARALAPLDLGGAPPWYVLALQSVLAALESLRLHRLRSALTMVGIIVGVCGVLVIDAVRQSQDAAIAAQLAQLGSNLIVVSSAAASGRGVSTGAGSRLTLTAEDAQAIRQRVPHVVAISPDESGRDQVIRGDRNANTQIEAAYPDVATIASYRIRQGSFFSTSDEAMASAVAVLGQTVVDRLFSDANPIGAPIRIRNVVFRVVGVLQRKGNNGQRDLDDVIVIPFRTGQERLFGHSPVGSILIQVDRSQDIPVVIAGVTRTLEETNRIATGRPDDFRIANYQAIVDAARQQAAIVTLVLTAIAGVALVIGGFGVTNVMLVGIAERTREIGLRMAVGAQPGDVLRQFLIEALFVSLLSGVLGIGAGFAVAALLPRAIASLAQHAALPSPAAAGVALAVAVLIGTIFGYYPARRAAGLDPIAALRDE